MVTVEQLKASGRLVDKDESITGVWEIKPPLAMIAQVDDTRGLLKKGQICLASKWSESGKHKGCLHFAPQLAFWWNMEWFDLVPSETTPA